MKTVFKVAKKALPSASIYFGIFCALLVAFSVLAGKEQEKNYQATELTIYVEDADASMLSKTLTEYLARENEVTTQFKKELVSDLVFTGFVDYVLYFEEGFEAKFLTGEGGGLERQSIRANVAFVDQKIELFFKYVRAELALGKSMEEACEAVLVNGEKQAETVVMVGKSTLLTPGYYFFTYLSYVLPAVLILVLGPVMNAFYKKDVKLRTDCGGVSVRKQNLTIVCGITFVALVLWGLLMFLGVIGYHKDFTIPALLCGILNSFLFLLVVLAISVLIGILVKGSDALNGASNLISMGMAFFCGVFVPEEMLPDAVNAVAEFLPASWYMKNVKLLFVGDGMAVQGAEFLKNCGIITLFAAAIFGVFLVVVKRKKVA